MIHGQDTQTRDIMAHHLEDLMLDCDLYGWDKVQAFYEILLNQIDQGHLS